MTTKYKVGNQIALGISITVSVTTIQAQSGERLLLGRRTEGGAWEQHIGVHCVKSPLLGQRVLDIYKSGALPISLSRSVSICGFSLEKIWEDRAWNASVHWL